MCRKYEISLNPKKIVFVLNEGNLLGFVVSKYGIMIEPKRTKVLDKITFPHNIKFMQSILGKINFVRRFVPSFAETVKPLQDMIKMDVEFKWGPKKRESVTKIKEETTKDSTLLIHDFSQKSILYIFVSDTAFRFILTEKKKERNQFPVYFMSLALQGKKLDYFQVDKKSYSLQYLDSSIALYSSVALQDTSTSLDDFPYCLLCLSLSCTSKNFLGPSSSFSLWDLSSTSIFF